MPRKNIYFNQTPEAEAVYDHLESLAGDASAFVVRACIAYMQNGETSSDPVVAKLDKALAMLEKLSVSGVVIRTPGQDENEGNDDTFISDFFENALG